MGTVQQSKRRQQIQRSLEREEAAFSKISQAADQVKALFQRWLDAAPPTGRPKRTEDRIQKAVSQLITEIHAGKMENVEERFQRLVERTEAAHLPKKMATFLQTLDAMQRLVEVSRRWHQSAPRSKVEQDWALHKLRVLLREVDAGQVENVEERFRQAMMQEGRPEMELQA
jgi:hypothetical protein